MDEYSPSLIEMWADEEKGFFIFLCLLQKVPFSLPLFTVLVCERDFLNWVTLLERSEAADDVKNLIYQMKGILYAISGVRVGLHSERIIVYLVNEPQDPVKNFHQ